MSEVEIIEFDERYADQFRDLNIEWITKYFRLENEDEYILNNPMESIIKKGGTILFARYENEIVGTCALINSNDGHFELAKMAITEKHQGKKIGKKLGDRAISKARELGAKKLSLETNSVLKPAITLYNSLGFEEKPHDSCSSAYERCNVLMELDL
ncbi:MAG: GNAT family N-acetyltransferase [Cyclobacteriaceae bacterium]